MKITIIKVIDNNVYV